MEIITTRRVSEGFTETLEKREIAIPRSRVLKLRYSRLWEINGTKTREIITTRRVSEGFFLTLRQTQKLNPSLTQRVVIVANAQLQNSRVGLGLGQAPGSRRCFSGV